MRRNCPSRRHELSRRRAAGRSTAGDCKVCAPTAAATEYTPRIVPALFSNINVSPQLLAGCEQSSEPTKLNCQLVARNRSQFKKFSSLASSPLPHCQVFG